MVSASTTPAIVACTPERSTKTHSARAEQQDTATAGVTPARFMHDQRRQGRRGQAEIRGEMLARVEQRDDHHGAEVVDDRERGRGTPSATPARAARAAT